MTTHTFDVVVPTDVREFIMEWAQPRGREGRGGFQSLYRMLATRLKAGKVLRITPDEMARIAHYATAYGNGGHQQVLRKLVSLWVAQAIDTLTPGKE